VATDNRLSESEVHRLKQEAQERVAKILNLRKREAFTNEVDSLVFRAKRVFSDSENPMAEGALRVVEELEAARDKSDEDYIQQKMGELSDMLSKYETADY